MEIISRSKLYSFTCKLKELKEKTDAENKIITQEESEGDNKSPHFKISISSDDDYESDSDESDSDDTNNDESDSDDSYSDESDPDDTDDDETENEEINKEKKDNGNDSEPKNKTQIQKEVHKLFNKTYKDIPGKKVSESIQTWKKTIKSFRINSNMEKDNWS